MATKTREDSVVGTCAWRAPELCNKQGAIHTEKSDIYSLGMTFWELASRKIPFANAPHPAIVCHWLATGVKEKIPEPKEDCPKKFGSLIAACWASPSKRPDAGTVVTYLKTNFAEFLPSFSARRANSAKVNPPEQNGFQSASNRDRSNVPLIAQMFL